MTYGGAGRIRTGRGNGLAVVTGQPAVAVASSLGTDQLDAAANLLQPGHNRVQPVDHAGD